jgi:hypothetical protein
MAVILEMGVELIYGTKQEVGWGEGAAADLKEMKCGE